MTYTSRQIREKFERSNAAGWDVRWPLLLGGEGKCTQGFGRETWGKWES